MPRCRVAGKGPSRSASSEQHVDTDPEVLSIDAVVDELDQPGGREDRPGGVWLVRPREDQQHVAVVDYRERDLSAERSTDLGEAQGEEVIFLGRSSEATVSTIPIPLTQGKELLMAGVSGDTARP